MVLSPQLGVSDVAIVGIIQDSHESPLLRKRVVQTPRETVAEDGFSVLYSFSGLVHSCF